jgi:hypothetical protein
MTGQELAKEGASMLPILLPDRATRKEAAARIHKRAQVLMRGPDVSTMDVGFFLFGLARAAEGKRNA